MRQVVGSGHRSTGRGNFGSKFEVRHCNQWGLCEATRPCFQITLDRLVENVAEQSTPFSHDKDLAVAVKLCVCIPGVLCVLLL